MEESRAEKTRREAREEIKSLLCDMDPDLLRIVVGQAFGFMDYQWNGEGDYETWSKFAQALVSNHFVNDEVIMYHVYAVWVTRYSQTMKVRKSTLIKWLISSVRKRMWNVLRAKFISENPKAGEKINRMIIETEVRRREWEENRLKQPDPYANPYAYNQPKRFSP